MVEWSSAMSRKAIGTRFVPGPPAWGPEPVTIVPAAITTHNVAKSNRTSHTISELTSCLRGVACVFERWKKAIATARTASVRTKWSATR